eukprot:scaffold108082_cov26-Tisochrysis_lutea.AAC.3
MTKALQPSATQYDLRRFQANLAPQIQIVGGEGGGEGGGVDGGGVGGSGEGGGRGEGGGGGGEGGGGDRRRRRWAGGVNGGGGEGGGVGGGGEGGGGGGGEGRGEDCPVCRKSGLDPGIRPDVMRIRLLLCRCGTCWLSLSLPGAIGYVCAYPSMGGVFVVKVRVACCDHR